MDSMNGEPENRSQSTVESVVFEQHLNAFDLMKLGLSSTFAIIIFIGIGYVVKHVAGPSAILSVLIAAFIAYLVGTFYTELNEAIVLSAIKTPVQLSQASMMAVGQHANANDSRTIEWLLPTHILVYICNGEFGAFVIAWNLIMEYIVIVALISKALIIYIDAIFFDILDHIHLTQIVPMSWYLSEYFDVFALLVPIVIGVPLLLLLGRNTIFNVISIALSLMITVIFLFFGIFNADIKNWTRNTGDAAANGDDNDDVQNFIQTGGFYAYGVNGVFKGVVNILFMFIAFDAMIMSRWAESIWFTKQHTSGGDTKPTNIEHFTKTITQAILSINTAIFLCLLGMAFALTTIQPIQPMDENIPLMSVIKTVFRDANEMQTTIRFITLIAGIVALGGSLYGILHAVQRVVHTMLSNDSTFKLFGKFSLNQFQREEIRQQFNDNDQTTTTTTTTATEHNKNRTNDIECNQRRKNQHRRQMYACLLLFSILSGLLAGLFSVEHLINILSIGTLFVLFALTIDIMILRYCGRLKQRLQQQSYENGTTTTATTTNTMEIRSIKLDTILLSAYCLLAAILSILIKISLSNDAVISPLLCWIFVPILIVGLVVIVFVLGMQPNGNAVFVRSFKHPFLPAIVLFGCIFLFTVFDAIAWIRFGVWTIIGLLFYFFALKYKPSRKPSIGVVNNGFTPESDFNQNQNNYTDTMASFETIALSNLSSSSIQTEDATAYNQKPSVSHLSNGTNSNHIKPEPIETESVEFVLDELKSPIHELNISPQFVATKVIQKQNVIDHSKLDEITSVDDIKDKCIECREPNGTTYFVEVDLLPNPVENVRYKAESLENDEKFERNMHESVLSQSKSQMVESQSAILPVPSEFEDSESEDEKEVRAIVHVSSEYSSQMENSSESSIEIDPKSRHDVKHNGVNEEHVEQIDVNEQHVKQNDVNELGCSTPVADYTPSVTPTEMRSDPLTPPTHTSVIKSIENHSRLAPNFQIGMYEAVPKQKLLYENDENRLAFKMRLENLFGQNDDAVASKSHFNTLSPRIPRITSLNHSVSAPDSLVIDDGVDDDGDNEKVISSKIPIPPAFNQELYNTIGHRNRKVFSSVSDVIDMNGNTTNDHVHIDDKKTNLSRTKAHENLVELDAHTNDGDDTSTHTIKRRLEEIFSKGRTVQQPVQKPNEVFDSSVNNNESYQRYSTKQIGPFDTVRKQKMLFSDVLKSIAAMHPDTLGNLHPNQNATDANDIQETQRRDSLD